MAPMTIERRTSYLDTLRLMDIRIISSVCVEIAFQANYKLRKEKFCLSFFSALLINGHKLIKLV